MIYKITCNIESATIVAIIIYNITFGDFNAEVTGWIKISWLHYANTALEMSTRPLEYQNALHEYKS